MKMIKRAINISLALSFFVTAAFAQSLDDAKTAIHSEQFDKAKTILKGLVTNRPDDGQNYFYLGEVYLKTDNADSAKIIFQKGVSTETKKFNLNKVGLGTVALREGDEATATKFFGEATEKLKKKDYEEFLYIGRAYTHAKKPNYDKALEYLTKAKGIKPEDPLVHVALGDAYLGKGDNSQAYIAYNEARNLDPSFILASVQLAVITKEAHAFSEAIEALKTIAQEHPTFAPTFRELAETYYLASRSSTKIEDYNSNLKEALVSYEKYMELTDESLESRMRYADFLILAKDYKTLQEQAAIMAQDADQNKRIFRYLGYAAYENGNYAESKKALDQFIASVEPDRIIAQDYLFLGKADLALGTDTVNKTIDDAVFDSGIANLKKAIGIDSTSAQPLNIAADLNEIGMKYFKSQQYGAAAKIFEVGSEVQSSKNVLYDNFYLGYALYFEYATHMNDAVKPDKAIAKKAAEAFAKVGELAPTTEQAFLYQAKSEYLIEDPENPQGLMVAPYEKFIQVTEEKGADAVTKNAKFLAEAHNVLGAYYTGKDEYEKARQHFEDTLILDPTNEYAIQSLDNLQPAQSGTTPTTN